jgi:hypothetical protein
VTNAIAESDCCGIDLTIRIEIPCTERGELLALRWQDIDLVGKGLGVRETVYEGHFGTPKTKRSNRGVPLCPKAHKILLELSFGASPEALVFATERGTPLCRRNLLNRRLRPTAQSLGMVGVNLHWLRYVNATFLTRLELLQGRCNFSWAFFAKHDPGSLHPFHRGRDADGTTEGPGFCDWTQLDPNPGIDRENADAKEVI